MTNMYKYNLIVITRAVSIRRKNFFLKDNLYFILKL